MQCHCGSGQPFAQCCQPFIDGQQSPETAEQLMRSRYSAYVEKVSTYLLATWHSSTRPVTLDLSDQQKWLGLSIKHTQFGQKGDDRGIVEFVARYKMGGSRAQRLHEVSQFVYEDKRWWYVDGDLS